MSTSSSSTEPPRALKNDESAGEVLVAFDGPVTIVTMHYPKRRNALSLSLRESLQVALMQANSDARCRVVILTGSEGNFSSGGDISGFNDVTPTSGRARMRQIHSLVRLITQSEKPVIAAVEGHAAGAGMCIAADCDIVVASVDAKFTCSFNKVGLLPDLGGLWSIPARVGLGTAKKLMFTGRTIDGTAAHACGLVDELCLSGEALQTALQMAHEIAQAAPLSNAMIKSALARVPQSLEETLGMEVNCQGLLYATDDFTEGRTAFLEKRKPRFEGK